MGTEVTSRGSSASRNCSLRLGSRWPMSICSRYPTPSSEFDRLDERDERLAGRRDEILRQIERRRSGWAKLVRGASEEIIEGEFHELPSGAPDVGPDGSAGSVGPGSGRTRKVKRQETAS